MLTEILPRLFIHIKNYFLLFKKPNVIKINENYQSIVIPQIFVGGDLILGPSTVAKAMANGKAVAENIHRYLNEN